MVMDSRYALVQYCMVWQFFCPMRITGAQSHVVEPRKMVA